MGEVQKLISEIRTPSEEFTPIPFWFFNDAPEEEKIRTQLADYVEKGVNGIVLHPRIGVPAEVPYLSEAYFQAVRWIVKTADELGMKVVLYDEGMYPSGSAHGMVVAENPEYASRGIALAAEPGEGQVVARLKDGRYLVYGFTHGTIRGIHFGEDDGEAGAPKSADILNPEAVELFIRLTHERYYEELKEYFGSTIIAFFTDEPCALGRNAAEFREWVPGMEEEIAAEGGSLEELEGLFTGRANGTTLIYHKLIKKHLRETFYARLSRWCEDHGISLMGHPEASDDIEEELYFHIPGQDLIMRRVAPETGGVREFDSVQAKLSADIARHLGRRRNANECFGVCNHRNIPWYFKGYDMKWYINWLGLRGVNLFVPHAFYYSVEGKRKEERPPDVGANNIWWPYYRKFSDYIKRVSYLMTDSVSFARVAVLCDNNRVPYREVAGLYEHQVDFHYLPTAMLSDCRTEQGKLCIRDCAFDAVLDVYGNWERVVRGKELAGVKVVRDAAELYDAEWRTVLAEPACESLRAVHMSKNGAEWYLLSNEGSETVCFDLALPALSEGQDAVCCLDLWSGKAQRFAVSKECDRIPVTLQPCEMLLFLPAKGEEMAQIEQELGQDLQLKRPAPGSAGKENLGDWTARFTLMEKEENRAVYTYIYQTELIEGGEYFSVSGEEMAVCDCNGQHVGESFYGPHLFQIGEYLKPGSNEIKITFTGNAVNLFGDIRVPFGLGVQEQDTLSVRTHVAENFVTLTWEKPEEMPGDACFRVYLNGREAGNCAGTSFTIEGLRSAAYYDVQVKIFVGEKEWRCSEVLHIHTEQAALH